MRSSIFLKAIVIILDFCFLVYGVPFTACAEESQVAATPTGTFLPVQTPEQYEQAQGQEQSGGDSPNSSSMTEFLNDGPLSPATAGEENSSSPSEEDNVTGGDQISPGESEATYSVASPDAADEAFMTARLAFAEQFNISVEGLGMTGLIEAISEYGRHNQVELSDCEGIDQIETAIRNHRIIESRDGYNDYVDLRGLLRQRIGNGHTINYLRDEDSGRLMEKKDSYDPDDPTYYFLTKYHYSDATGYLSSVSYKSYGPTYSFYGTTDYVTGDGKIYRKEMAYKKIGSSGPTWVGPDEDDWDHTITTVYYRAYKTEWYNENGAVINSKYEVCETDRWDWQEAHGTVPNGGPLSPQSRGVNLEDLWIIYGRNNIPVPSKVTLATGAAEVAVFTTPSNTVLAWNAAMGATGYMLEVWSSTGTSNTTNLKFSKAIGDVTSITLTQSDLDLLNSETKYYWRVRGTNEDALEGPWSNFGTFKLQRYDDNLRWIVPDGQVGNWHTITYAATDGIATVAPVLGWAKNSEAVSYEWELFKGVSAFIPGIPGGPYIERRESLASGRTSENFYEFPNDVLDMGKLYFWRVRCVDAFGKKGSWYDGIFRVGTAFPLRIASTTNLAVSNLLEWDAAPGAVSYRVQIGSFSKVVNANSAILEPSDLVGLGLNSGQTYSYSVHVIDQNGVEGRWSAVGKITLPPALQAPQNAKTSQIGADPSFSWTAVSGAVSYELSVYKVGTTVPVLTETVNAASYTIERDRLAVGQYYYKVCAIDVFGNKGAAKPSSNFTLAALAKPVLTGNNSTVNVREESPEPVFKWSAVSGANLYACVVLDGTTEVYRADTATLQIAIPKDKIPAGKTYTLKVTPKNNFLSGPSNQISFTTTNVLSKTTLITGSSSVFNFSTLSDLLTWNAVTGAASYKVEIWLDENTWDSKKKILTKTVSENSTALTQAEFDLMYNYREYRYRVKAFDQNGVEGEWSNLGKIKLPQLAAPKSLKVSLTGTESFSWEWGGAVAFKVWLRIKNADGSLGKGILEETVRSSSYIIDRDKLIPDQQYHFEIRGIDVFGKSGSSAYTSFTTYAPKAPVLTGNGSTVRVREESPDPVFKWSAVSNANLYTCVVLDGTTEVFRFDTSATQVAIPRDKLSHGVTYTLQVTPKNNFVSGALSQISFKATKAFPPTTLITGNPSVFTFSSPSDLLNWNSLVGAASYKLEIWKTNKLTNEADRIVTKTVQNNSAELSQDDFDLMNPNTVYYYRVQGVDRDGIQGEWSALGQIKLPQLLAVGSVTVSFTAANPFSWSAVKGAVVYGVALYDKLNSKNPILAKTITGTSDTIENGKLVVGKQYYYEVYAVDAFGRKGAVKQSAVFKVTASAKVVFAEDNPSSVSVREESADPVFEWAAAKDANAYTCVVLSGTKEIFRTDTANNYITIPKDVILSEKKYTLQVTAKNNFVAGSPSTMSFATTDDLAKAKLITGRSSVFTFSTPSDLLSWVAVGGAVSYEVEIWKSKDTKRESNKIASKTVDVNNISLTQADFDLMNANTSYYYRVRAVGGNGDTGQWSSMGTIKIPAPKAPSVSVSTSYSSLSFSLKNSQPGCTYAIEFSNSNKFKDVFKDEVFSPGVYAIPKSFIGGFSSDKFGNFYYRIKVLNAFGKYSYVIGTIKKSMWQ